MQHFCGMLEPFRMLFRCLKSPYIFFPCVDTYAMGKRIDNMKLTANKFIKAFEGETTHLIDESAKIVRDFNK